MKRSKGATPKKPGYLLTALPLAAQLCSTCVFWGGAREVTSRGFIKIHPYSKGECRGDGFKHLEMGALAACGDWAPCLSPGGEKCGRQERGSG